MSNPIRLAVLLSGSGTTLQNFIDRIADGRLAARVVQVISNRRDAYGLTRAAGAGIPTAVVERRECADQEEFSRRIFGLCQSAQADLVCMAGFLQLIKIPEQYALRVLNIHPSLIPSFCGKGFYGLRVHEAVLSYGAKITGCTVHYADNEYDHGPILLQRAVPVLDDDIPETLAARVFEQECEAYPEAIQRIAEKRVQLFGRRVKIRPLVKGRDLTPRPLPAREGERPNPRPPSLKGRWRNQPRRLVEWGRDPMARSDPLGSIP